MKILVINTVPTTQNGITNVIFNYLTSMDMDGMQMDYLSINNPDVSYVYDVERRGGKLFVVPRDWKHILSYYKSLKHIVGKGDYDIVHIHGNSHFNVLDLYAAYKGGCKNRIVHCHNTTCGSPLLHRLLTPLFNGLYTNGFACGKDAGRWMFGERPFTVINNGVNTSKYKFRNEIRKMLRKELGWEHNFVIGNVASMIPAKNHKFIIDVFNELCLANPDSRLLLIGDGYLKKEIEQQIANKGLEDKVHMTGNIDNVNEYLNVMDCILMPSLYEGLPLSLIEQQANGLRCLVTTTVSSEADKTGNLKFLPLQTPMDMWVECLRRYEDETMLSRSERSGMAIEKIRNAGYSIGEESKKVKEIYKKLVR